MSAKTFIVDGLKVIPGGRNYVGILPIRGKLLNVRDASHTVVSENKEITAIIKMLGLKHGTDYSNDANIKSLRYGQLRILTDSDNDGNHIKGLIINFFKHFFPTLVARNFIGSIRTPIVKVFQNKKQICFYYEQDFHDWEKKQAGKKFKAKYFKGLGTSKTEDVKQVFKEPYLVIFTDDSAATEKVDMVFSGKRANDRKAWLENYTDHSFKYLLDDIGIENVPISEFFDNEMIQFSIADNKRSIPNVIDGLKPSQRKILYVGMYALKDEEVKLETFAAQVNGDTAYHHGSNSLESTIIGMAQTFVGSNNIPLLLNNGQFGSKLENGKDAAHPRYLCTQLPKITRKIFRAEDDPILTYLFEDGRKIEPKFYVPIIPMVLVNGSKGIGTGWSSDIPTFDPLEIVKWIKEWIKDPNSENLIRDFFPWYKNFKGSIEQDENDPATFYNYGVIEKLGECHYQVSELPIGVSIEDFKDHLEKLKTGLTKGKSSGSIYDSMTVSQLKEELKNKQLPQTGTKKVLVEKLKTFDKANGVSFKKTGKDGQLIAKYQDLGDAVDIKIDVWTRPGVELELTQQFKLKERISLTNLTAFMPTGGIKKFMNIVDILTTFCTVRLEYYQLRKKHLITVLELEKTIAENKARFIKKVLQDINILRQDEKDLYTYLSKENYYKKIDAKDNDFYGYLTNMQIRICTNDKFAALQTEIADITEKIAYIKKRAAADMWLDELDEFCKIY